MEMSDVAQQEVVAPTIQTTRAPRRQTKKTAPKVSGRAKTAPKTKTAKAPKVRAEPKEKKVATIIPSELEKRFNANAIVSFCNAYFGTLSNHTMNFVQYKEPKSKKVKNNQNIIDLSAIDAIDRFRHAIESNTESRPIQSITYIPHIRSVLDFYADGAVTPERFQELCSDFGIQTLPSVDVRAFLEKFQEYLHDNARIPRIFNAVFGEFYARKYTEPKDVHKRYLQRSPEMLRDILKSKNDSFADDIKKLATKYANVYYKQLSKSQQALNKKLGTNAVEKVFTKPDQTNIFKGRNAAQLKKLPEFADATIEDVEALLKTYNELVVVYNFIRYINEIDDEAFYHQKFSIMEGILAEYENTYAIIERLKTSIESGNEWSTMIKALVHMSRLHMPFCSKNKKPFMTLLNSLQRNGTYINIKNDRFKRAIDELAAEKHDDSHCETLASTSENIFAQLAVGRNYDASSETIYSKMGAYIYHNWAYDKPIAAVQIRKATKVAVGMQIFVTISEALATMKMSKKTTKIVLKF